MGLIPQTTQTIEMGRVRRAYTNISPSAGANISLRATLGSYIGVSSGSISLSSAFGGRTTPYTY